FVGDLHRLVARVSPRQPPRDLLRGPMQAQLPGDNLLQSSPHRQPTGLRATGAVPAALLGGSRSRAGAAAMAADLAADRGGCPLERGGDRPHRLTFREAACNLSLRSRRNSANVRDGDVL